MEGEGLNRLCLLPNSIQYIILNKILSKNNELNQLSVNTFLMQYSESHFFFIKVSPSIDFLNLDTILQRYTEIRITKYTSNVLDFKVCPKKWPEA